MRHRTVSRLWIGMLGTAFLSLACTSARQEHQPRQRAAVAVRVLMVQAAPQEQFYEASGTVRARQRAVLASRLQATVRAVPVKLGDAVREGQVVAELDASETDAELRRAEAAQQAAEHGWQQAQRAQQAAEAEARLAAVTLARFRQLLERNSVSQQEFDQAEARHAAAQAALEMAKARADEAVAHRSAAAAAVDSARIRQSYTRITAPFNGYVAEKIADAGSVVSPGMPLLTVEESAGYQLDVSLPESRIRAVKLGDRVRFSVAAIGLESEGRVAEMQPGAEAGSRAVLVRIALPDRPGLRSGLFGRAVFALGQREVLAVPAELVLRQGELRFVYVIEDRVARKRLVTVGRTEQGKSEVLSGLAAGEQIAASALDSLADGTPVEMQP